MRLIEPFLQALSACELCQNFSTLGRVTFAGLCIEETTKPALTSGRVLIIPEPVDLLGRKPHTIS